MVEVLAEEVLTEADKEPVVNTAMPAHLFTSLTRFLINGIKIPKAKKGYAVSQSYGY